MVLGVVRSVGRPEDRAVTEALLEEVAELEPLWPELAWYELASTPRDFQFEVWWRAEIQAWLEKVCVPAHLFVPQYPVDPSWPPEDPR